jgi:hypothetical protein
MSGNFITALLMPDDDPLRATQELVRIFDDNEDTQPYIVLDELRETADVGAFFPRWKAFREKAAARGWVKAQ